MVTASAADGPENKPRDSGVQEGPALQRSEIRPGEFLLVAIELFAVLHVANKFSIEEDYGLLTLLPCVLGGFVIHAWAPLKLKLPCFFAVSIVGILAVLGPYAGSAVIVAGLVMIGLCHLPAPYSVRVGAILGVAALMVALRAEWISTPFDELPIVIVPVLAAMFMFRLVIYLYDLRHEKQAASIWERLSYFFLLPNVCFLLFPVIDYQTFRRTYYDKPAFDIYQKGVLWIVRGIVHLLVYRLVYYHFTIAPTDVVDLGSSVRFMVSTYLLYLHISGHFHLIIGILCLFGFNLPETHHLYFLASGFNDYWRRINIYWKDFMMKVVYYPVLVRVKFLGLITAITVATIVVFFGTWLLHSYQWFWLRGEFPLKANDAMFWGIFGLLVVVNSILEARRGRRRTLGKSVWSVGAAILHSMKVIGMLVTITVLWSLWNSPSLGDFMSVLSAAARSGPWDWWVFVAGLLALIALGVAIQFLQHRGVRVALVGHSPPARQAAVNSCLTLIALAVIGSNTVYRTFDSQMPEVVASIKQQRLSDLDLEQLDVGYYQELLDIGGYTSALARTTGRTPSHWVNIREYRHVIKSSDMIDYKLAPSSRGIFKGEELVTNQWGMRDKEYPKAKPAGTYRMALLGASYEMGSGVKNHEVYEAVLEDMLNDSAGEKPYKRYEILNFAVGGYTLLHYFLQAKSEVLEFNPDVVVLALHYNERVRIRGHLSRIQQARPEIPYPAIAEAIRELDAAAERSPKQFQESLDSHASTVLRWTLLEMARLFREAGVPVLAIYVPTTAESKKIKTDARDELMKLTADVGIPFLWLENPFGSRENIERLYIAEWDTHPNEKGHRKLAESLFRLMQSRPEEFALGGAPNPAGVQ